MKYKDFYITKKIAFEACKTALKKFHCNITYSDILDGIIESKKEGNILSFGHNIKIHIKSIKENSQKISISSNSIGVQIFDWGTNSKNEDKLMDIITNLLR